MFAFYSCDGVQVSLTLFTILLCVAGYTDLTEYGYEQPYCRSARPVEVRAHLQVCIRSGF